MLPEIPVPSSAELDSTTLLPAADCKSTPTAPPFTGTLVAFATCEADGARSKTVSQRRLAVFASVGRISSRHTLFHVRVSEENCVDVVIDALAGRIVVMEPANKPVFTSKRCNPTAGGVTSTGLAAK